MQCPSRINRKWVAQDVHMERNHLIICCDRFLDLRKPGFVSSPEKYWIRRVDTL